MITLKTHFTQFNSDFPKKIYSVLSLASKVKGISSSLIPILAIDAASYISHLQELERARRNGLGEVRALKKLYIYLKRFKLRLEVERTFGLYGKIHGFAPETAGEFCD